jgi:hypothetical protein
MTLSEILLLLMRRLALLIMGGSLPEALSEEGLKLLLGKGESKVLGIAARVFRPAPLVPALVSSQRFLVRRGESGVGGEKLVIDSVEGGRLVVRVVFLKDGGHGML